LFPQYEVTLLSTGLARVGWATCLSNFEIGHDNQSFGYGGSGKKSYNGLVFRVVSFYILREIFHDKSEFSRNMENPLQKTMLLDVLLMEKEKLLLLQKMVAN
jgi:hypothetical protein